MLQCFSCTDSVWYNIFLQIEFANRFVIRIFEFDLMHLIAVTEVVEGLGPKLARLRDGFWLLIIDLIKQKEERV